jgi:hypothetical protein
MLAIIKESSGDKVFMWSHHSKPNTVRVYHTNKVKYPNTTELSLQAAKMLVDMVRECGHLSGSTVERYAFRSK